jgi:predicted TPR repeat methyltransferase
MDPWKLGRAYDEITHLWERKDFNRANGIEAHERAIAFTQSRGRALDVGCGCTGRFITLMQEEGFKPEGVDVSEKMLELAARRHPEVTFHHQDICAWDIPEKYDFITAWDSIWHLPIAAQEPVLSKLVASLNPGGVLIFSFGGTEKPGDHTDDAMGPEVYYSSLGTNGLLQLLIGLGCMCRHLEYDQYPELHAFLIVQKSG